MACEKTDGHFTLMRFTTGWKAMFQTPDLLNGEWPAEDGQDKGEYTRISNIPMEETMGDAIISAIYDEGHREA